MTGNYKCIRPERLEELIRNAVLHDDLDAVSKFLHPDRYAGERSFASKDPHINIGKAWHGLHFLLTGSTDVGEAPLCYVVLGGKVLGDEEVGCGPATYVMPEQVKKAADSLAGLREEKVRKIFSPIAFAAAGIYPECWAEEHADKHFAWLWETLVLVRGFFQQAAQYGDAILFWLA